MFSWFSRKQKNNREQKKTPERLPFKGSEDAFEYISQHMPSSVENDNFIYGLVLGPGKPFGKDPLLSKISGNNYLQVKLSTTRGIFVTENCGFVQSKALSRRPESGDLVAVKVGSSDSAYPIDSVRNYFIIIMILTATLDTKRNIFLPDVSHLTT